MNFDRIHYEEGCNSAHSLRLHVEVWRKKYSVRRKEDYSELNLGSAVWESVWTFTELCINKEPSDFHTHGEKTDMRKYK